MALKCGIIGLTNIGKTTLFNCISNTKAETTSFAYSTNKSNMGVATVPDMRLLELDKIIKANNCLMCNAQHMQVLNRSITCQQVPINGILNYRVVISRQEYYLHVAITNQGRGYSNQV